MDIIKYGVKMRQERKHLEMGVRGGGSILRRTPRGEVYAVLQMVRKLSSLYILLNMSLKYALYHFMSLNPAL